MNLDIIKHTSHSNYSEYIVCMYMHGEVCAYVSVTICLNWDFMAWSKAVRTPRQSITHIHIGKKLGFFQLTVPQHTPSGQELS